MSSHRRSTQTESPYENTVGFARAVRQGKRIYVSGTAPIWPDGHVSPDPMVQTRRVWEIALGALAELGGSSADVVRTRHYITDLDIVDVVSQVHGEFFGDVRPASTMVLVAGLLDSRWKVEVEIDAIVTTKHRHGKADVTAGEDS
ncbi:MAG: RidA family protein [Nostocoides sp.]